ncbi:MAG: hypothetical protein COA52_01090 [Hyphomicrobiales bacterium]|nr:MAG: hypothetical protein COA52_01090 [Hyphomicrobiales bacterium]
MSSDNPTVNEALVNAKAVREEQEEKSSLRKLQKKLSNLVNNTADLLDDNVEMNKNIAKESKALITPMDFISGFSALRGPTIPNENVDKDITISYANVEPAISLEDTQKSVLNAISDLPKTFVTPFKYFAEKLNEVVFGIHETKLIADQTLETENRIYDIIAEQNEAIRTSILRGEGMDTPIFQPDLSFVDKLKVAIDESIKMMPNYAQVSLGLVGRAINFFVKLTAILIPFSKLLLGGVVLATVATMGTFAGEFEKTGKALKKLFDSGDLKEVGSNILNTFGSLAEDIADNFEWSDDFTELMQTFKDLKDNQIIPAFDYIINDVFKSFAEEMHHVFVDVLGPKFQAALDWFKEPGNINSITDGLKIVSDFVSDALIFFFGDLLPPILDSLGGLFKIAILAVKNLYKLAKIVIPPLATGLKELVTDVATTIGALADHLGDLFNAESFVEILMAVGDIATDLAIFVLNMVDNALTTLFKVLSLDKVIGLKDGESIVERIARFMGDVWNGITNKIDEFDAAVRKAFTDTYNDLSSFIESINPVTFIKEKIVALVDLLKDLIPSVDDIKAAIKDTIKSIPLIGETLHDTIYGEDPIEKASKKAVTIQEETKNPFNFDSRWNGSDGKNIHTENNMEDLMKSLSNLSDGLNNTPVIIQNNIAAPVAPQSSASTDSRVSGVARTTPQMTPSDRHLYGSNHLFGGDEGNGW